MFFLYTEILPSPSEFQTIVQIVLITNRLLVLSIYTKITGVKSQHCRMPEPYEYMYVRYIPVATEFFTLSPIMSDINDGHLSKVDTSLRKTFV